MSAAPGVSVVVPTHRRPELMRRAVESALAQDYAGVVEVIVVFDAETPYRPDVEVGEGRSLRVIANDRSRGLAGARNSGILAAAEPYVAFLDDDDHWFPGKLTAQMPRFEDPTAPVLVCSAVVFEDGERSWNRLVGSDRIEHPRLVRDRVAGAHSSTFVARRDDFLGRLGLVDEELPGSYGEDYDVLLRAARLAPVAVVDRPLVGVTWAQGSHYLGKWTLYADGLEYLLRKHSAIADDRHGYSRVASQIAFACASGRNGARARRWALRSLRHNPGQVRAWLALAVSLRLLSAAWVVRTVQRMGKGI